MVGAKKKNKKTNIFQEISDSFEKLTKNPELFLKPQPDKIDAIHELLQKTYSICISDEDKKNDDILTELVLEDMDDEQIWQQLEIRNEFVLEELVKDTAYLTSIREQHLGIELADDDDGDDDEEEEVADVVAKSTKKSQIQALNSDGSDLETDDEYASKKKGKKKSTIEKTSRKVRKSVVDDTFFKLDEMKQFLEQEDAKEMRKQKHKKNLDDADDVDYFADDFGLGDDDDVEDGTNVNYADFFDMDPELREKARHIKKDNERDFFNENADESEADEDNDVAKEGAGDEDDEEQAEKEPSEIDEAEFVAKSGVEPVSDSGSDDDDNDKEEDATKAMAVQSANEMREARLLQRIQDYEDIVLGEKPWQLKGEVKAGSRPQNSLLEEILEFESTTRPTAAITEEDNRTIEEMIKQRIRDKAWDDVVPKVRPMQTQQEYRKQLVLDQEKSKDSLAKIYEQQYQRELDKIDPNRNDDSTAPEPKEHQEIRRAMRNLFVKLDALSNFHFTPKPVAPEAKIVTNTPAIQMEEVAPIAVSDAKLLAPEEVYRGTRSAPLGETERTRTDKNRERRKKKQKQRAINAALEAREQLRAKQGKAPTKRDADAKLLKTITKSRNVHKITSSNDQSALKSSKAFFSKLQDTTTSVSSNSAGKKRPKKDITRANAKKLKL